MAMAMANPDIQDLQDPVQEKVTVNVKILSGDFVTFELESDIAKVGVLETRIYDMFPDIPCGCARLYRFEPSDEEPGDQSLEPLKRKDSLVDGETLHLLALASNENVKAKVSHSNNWIEASVIVRGGFTDPIERYDIEYYDDVANDWGDRIRSTIVFRYPHGQNEEIMWVLEETLEFVFTPKYYTYRETPETKWYSDPLECIKSSKRSLPNDPDLLEKIDRSVRLVQQISYEKNYYYRRY